MVGLHLDCRAVPEDRLDVFGNDTVDGTPVVQIFAKDRDSSIEICLDEDHARALFNWLAVWLHGGNRD